MDWEDHFKYLEPAHTRPSVNDLYNSLRTDFAKPEAAAIAALVVIMFDRIAALEAFASQVSADAQLAGRFRVLPEPAQQRPGALPAAGAGEATHESR